MYAIFEHLTLDERTLALELFINRATRLGSSTRTIQWGALGVPDRAPGHTNYGLDPNGTTFCPLGAAIWAKHRAALRPQLLEQREEDDRADRHSSLAVLLYPGDNSATEQLAGPPPGGEAQLDWWDKRKSAQQLIDDYDAGKLDDPPALYAAFGVPWPEDALSVVTADSQKRVWRLNASASGTVRGGQGGRLRVYVPVPPHEEG